MKHADDEWSQHDSKKDGRLNLSYTSNQSSDNSRFKTMKSIIGGAQDYASSRGFGQSSVGSKQSLFSRSNSVMHLIDKHAEMQNTKKLEVIEEDKRPTRVLDDDSSDSDIMLKKGGRNRFMKKFTQAKSKRQFLKTQPTSIGRLRAIKIEDIKKYTVKHLLEGNQYLTVQM